MQTQLLPLTSILDDGRQRQDYGDLAGLISSIEANGLLQPIVVTEAGDWQSRLASGCGTGKSRRGRSTVKPPAKAGAAPRRLAARMKESVERFMV